MLTKDLVPVVVHDEQLGRTVAGTGLISATTFAQLTTLDAGSWYDASLSHVRVPSFVQVLDFCTRHGIWMNIEIKPADGFDKVTGQCVAQTVLDFYQNTNVELPLFSSFSMVALQAAMQVAPLIPRGALCDRVPANWIDYAEALDVVAVHTNHRYLTAAAAAEIRQHGFGLACYTVNDPVRASELFSMGVDAVFTDNLLAIPANFTPTA